MQRTGNSNQNNLFGLQQPEQLHRANAAGNGAESTQVQAEIFGRKIRKMGFKQSQFARGRDKDERLFHN